MHWKMQHIMMQIDDPKHPNLDGGRPKHFSDGKEGLSHWSLDLFSRLLVFIIGQRFNVEDHTIVSTPQTSKQSIKVVDGARLPSYPM